jgi:hypothetical protein
MPYSVADRDLLAIPMAHAMMASARRQEERAERNRNRIDEYLRKARHLP